MPSVDIPGEEIKAGQKIQHFTFEAQGKLSFSPSGNCGVAEGHAFFPYGPGRKTR
jgi:hypothetical protein